MRGKNYIQTIGKVGAVFLKQGLVKQKNRERIKNVLKWDFKPLFGIDTFVHLHGHTHTDPFIFREIELFLGRIRNNSIDDNILSTFKATLKSSWFKNQVSIYKKDMHTILDIIKQSSISVIWIEGNEDDVKNALSLMDIVENNNAIFYARLQELWFDEKSIAELFLLANGPVRWLYLVWNLPWITFVGVEWDTYKEAIHMLEESIDMIKSNPNKKDWHALFKDASTGQMTNRNVQIAQNMQQYKWKNILVVIWASHVQGIKELMGSNWKVKTSFNCKY